MPGFETIFSNPMGTLNLSKKILECIGLLESIDSKLNKLVQCKLNSGIDTFRMAAKARSQESQEKFLWSALNFFIEAKQLEKNERLCVSYVGIIFCLLFLGEKGNTIDKLKEFAYTDFNLDEWGQTGKFFQKQGYYLFKRTALNPLYLVYYYLVNPIIWRKEIFEELIKLPDSIKEYFELRRIGKEGTVDSIDFRIQYGEKQLQKIEKIIFKLNKQRINDPDIIFYEHDREILTKKIYILSLRKQALEFAERLEKELLQIQPDDSQGLT